MSSYTLTTTCDIHSFYNLTWCWWGKDKWFVKNIPAWHWESFLGFTCLGFYLERSPVYSIKGWETVSLNLRSPTSRHCCRCRRCSCHHYCHRRSCRRNHCHTKSPLCKWVYWTPITFQILKNPIMPFHNKMPYVLQKEKSLYPYPRIQLYYLNNWHLVVCQLWLSKQSFLFLIFIYFI